MIHKRTLLMLLVFAIILISCNRNNKSEEVEVNVIDVASKQYGILFDSIQSRKNNKFYIPRSIKNGNIKYAQAYDWTSGFYAGSLWYLYKLSGDIKWKNRALDYTTRLDSVKYYTGNHDIGFMMETSFGNAIKDKASAKYDSVIVESAKSLVTRFRPKAGIIQSWNANEKWDCPVIIDNMMNLELLFHATKISGDSTYYNVAIKHADVTLENHFREDYSSYHVIDYNTETGEVIGKSTHQGLSDDSDWSRGQTWGLYGYTTTYRETKNIIYLEQAIKIANFIKTHPKLPEDQVPLWDFDAEMSPETPRDASSAAITASALLELSGYVNTDLSKTYIDWAKQILNSLKSAPYLAEVGTNKGFILKHSVGTLPNNVEVDVPLNYADYYFLEALYRSKNLN